MISHTYFINLFFSFFTGIGAGMISLLLSTIFHRFIDEYVLISIIVYATIEELSKAAGLFGLKSASSFWHAPFMTILSGGIIGLGFGIFELILITLSTNPLEPTIFFIIAIHGITGLIIGLGVLFSKRFPFLCVVALLLAIGLHVWYNQIVVQSHTIVPIM